jgi:hypothetical protein
VLTHCSHLLLLLLLLLLQVRDLMVFIEAQKTIQSEGGELQDATLLPMPAKEASSSSGRRRSSRK